MSQNRGILKCRGRRRELGQAMIEVSLVLSFVLVPIVMGMAGFAAYLGNFMALTDAVSYGAKELSMSRGAVSLDPCKVVTTAVTNAYKAAAVETATPTLTVTLTLYSAGSTTASYTSGGATTCPSGLIACGSGRNHQGECRSRYAVYFWNFWES